MYGLQLRSCLVQDIDQVVIRGCSGCVYGPLGFFEIALAKRVFVSFLDTMLSYIPTFLISAAVEWGSIHRVFCSLDFVSM